jgi:type IV secretion system protein VirB10
MSDAPTTPGTVPVTDQRPRPSGVLPRRAQTWLMAGIAIAMIAIILIAGRPEPLARPVATGPVQASPNPDRVRDYQDRLRMLETRAAQDTLVATPPPAAPPASVHDTRVPTPEDALVAERRRREYESLFASNVVLSRRPAGERPDVGQSSLAARNVATSDTRDPSIDAIADAVVRATVRSGTSPTASTTSAPDATGITSSPTTRRPERQLRTEPIRESAPLHRLLEGTVIDTVLTNRLDGSTAAPVACLVTNPIYSHGRRHIVIPAGARVLGETKPVQAFGETRLAVAFHRLVMPDGSTQSLDQFLATNQIGDAGLRDRVNQHYWSTFGAAGAVGLISGLAQFLGATGLGTTDGDRPIIIAGSASDATAQASVQVLNRFLNRMPTITIREGHRVKVYLTSDLELPAYHGDGASTFEGGV